MLHINHNTCSRSWKLRWADKISNGSTDLKPFSTLHLNCCCPALPANILPKYISSWFLSYLVLCLFQLWGSPAAGLPAINLPTYICSYLIFIFFIILSYLILSYLILSYAFFNSGVHLLLPALPANILPDTMRASEPGSHMDSQFPNCSFVQHLVRIVVGVREGNWKETPVTKSLCEK